MVSPVEKKSLVPCVIDPFPCVEARVFEERVDLSNNMTWRQMIGVGVRNVVLARGELDKLEGPNYAARRAELRRAAREAARARQTAAASQNEAEESDESEDETAGERTRTRVRRTSERWHEGRCENW